MLPTRVSKPKSLRARVPDANEATDIESLAQPDREGARLDRAMIASRNPRLGGLSAQCLLFPDRSATRGGGCSASQGGPEEVAIGVSVEAGR